jgi:hypothetical protein
MSEAGSAISQNERIVVDIGDTLALDVVTVAPRRLRVGIPRCGGDG